MGEVINSGFRHRRSHLKSKTVDTLLKIISLCADHQESQISNPLPITSDALSSGVRRNDSENELVKDNSVEVVLGGSESLSIGNDISVDDYSIENLNLLVENVNCSIENNLLSDKNIEPIGVEDLMNVDEVGSLVVKNCCDKLEELQHGIVEEIKVDECVSNENREPIRPIEDMQVQSSSSEQNVVNEVAGEARQEEMGLTKPVNLDSSVCILTDIDVEDREIPDSLGIYDELVDIVHEDLASNEDKSGGEDQIHHQVTKERGIRNEHQEDTGAHEKYMSSTCTREEILEKKNEGKLDRDYSLGARNRNLKRGYGDALLLEAGNSGKENGEANVDATTKKVRLSDRKLEQGYADDWLQDAGTSEKENGEAGVAETTKKSTKVGEKRLRVLPKERKAKKKMNGRKKRAQTRREQGVKKLRIEPPIAKPKAPKYCEFYLKGRCREGDSCKFSHDTTPLTKSQPCKFLAGQQQCLNGDKCPYDHQLSKYPCNNYASNGFCIRGDRCLFSHKIVETPIPSKVSPTKAVSQPLPNNSNSKRNQNTEKISLPTLNNISSGASLNTPSSTGTQVRKKPEQNVSGKLRPLAQPPKGVTLLSFGNSPLIDSSKKTPLAQPPKGVTLLSLGNSPLVDYSKKTPLAQPPKGVTLLSLGKSPLVDYSKKTGANGTEASTQRVQESSEISRNSKELLQKTTPSSSSQFLQNPLQKVQNKNSAQRAPPSSTLAFAAKYESEMMKNWSKFPTGLSTTTDSSKTPSSTASSSIDDISNRLMKASPLLQEFLFGFGGVDGINCSARK